MLVSAPVISIRPTLWLLGDMVISIDPSSPFVTLKKANGRATSKHCRGAALVKFSSEGMANGITATRRERIHML